LSGKYRAPEIIQHAFGFKSGIDLDKLNQRADELESETYAAGQQSPHDSAHIYRQTHVAMSCSIENVNQMRGMLKQD
jgi:hypothetical protein